MPHYTSQYIESMEEQFAKVQMDLLRAGSKLLAIGNAAPESRLRDHLKHGAARRILVIRRSLENLFAMFPPSRMEPLANHQATDAQIWLNSVLINLSGLGDNLAWCFVAKHGADEMDRRDVGLWRKQTQKLMHEDLRNYLNEPSRREWATQYMTDFRDAAAHRIPAYVPACSTTVEEGARIAELELLKLRALQDADLEALRRFEEEQDGIGISSPMFLHSFMGEDASRQIQLHPQMISDAQTCVDLTETFLLHWEKRS